MDTPSGNDLSTETLTGAPPPPQEVKVRTMQSDLASMTASGGGLPRFQNVKIASIPDAPPDSQATARKMSLFVAILSIIVLMILLVVGYFVYKAFWKDASPLSLIETAAARA